MTSFFYYITDSNLMNYLNTILFDLIKGGDIDTVAKHPGPLVLFCIDHIDN